MEWYLTLGAVYHLNTHKKRSLCCRSTVTYILCMYEHRASLNDLNWKGFRDVSIHSPWYDDGQQFSFFSVVKENQMEWAFKFTVKQRLKSK